MSTGAGSERAPGGAAAFDCLFVPHSTDDGGSGEYMRCQILARAIQIRWPRARIRFVLHRDAPYTGGCPFEVIAFAGHHKRKADLRARHALISRTITTLPRRSVVFFDSAGRSRHFLDAFRRRLPVIYVSSRPDIRRKAFDWARLLPQRQHWLLRDIPTEAPALGAALRFRARLRGVELVDLPTVFEQAAADAEGPDVVLVHGGGTRVVDGRPAPELFLEVGRQLSRRLGLRSLVIGPPAAASDPRTRCIPWLENAALMGLMATARLNVVGGGSLVGQAIALDSPTLAVSFGRKDQDRRVQRLLEQGVLASAPPRADEMVAAAVSLLESPQAMERQLERRQAFGVSNGVPRAMAAFARLLDSM